MFTPGLFPPLFFSLQPRGSFTPRISHPRIFHPLQVPPLPDCSHPFFVLTSRKVHPLGIYGYMANFAAAALLAAAAVGSWLGNLLNILVGFIPFAGGCC